MKKYDTAIAGYTCVDLVPEFRNAGCCSGSPDLFRPGKLIEIDGIHVVPGGVVANTGMAMRKFDRKVFLNGLVGDDFMGRIIKEWFGKYNVSEGIQTTKKAGTACSIVIAPPGTDRIFLESPGCNAIFDTSFINLDEISQTRLFHFGYPPLLKPFFQDNGSQLADLFSGIQSSGVVTSLDFSLPDPEGESGKINWPEFMHNVLPFTDIFVPSLEEALRVMLPGKYTEMKPVWETPGSNSQIPVSVVREAGRMIIESGAKIVLIKAGGAGIYLLTGDMSVLNGKSDLALPEDAWSFREMWCKPYHADPSGIVNSNGAGDVAVAAFLSAILSAETVESSLRYAAMAGRNTLYCRNISIDLPGWEEMTKEIASEPSEIIDFMSASQEIQVFMTGTGIQSKT